MFELQGEVVSGVCVFVCVCVCVCVLLYTVYCIYGVRL